MKSDDRTIAQQTLPTARKDDLSITWVNDETVVYDLLTHRASCLNKVTATVWNACNGKNNEAALLDALTDAGFQDIQPKVVRQALQQLSQTSLLTETTDTPAAEHTSVNVNRRQVLRSLSRTTVAAIPVISSITIQSAAVAQSCINPSPCNRGSRRCCPGFSCRGRRGRRRCV